MILDKAWVELNEINGVELLKNIELAAKQCYRSQGNITEDSYKNFLRNCINRGHESVIEHEKVTVRLKTDVGSYKDLTRHRHASFSVESTRYCNYSKDKFGNAIHYIKPVWYTDSWKIAQSYNEPMTEEEQKSYEWYKCMEEIEQHYLKMSELGCTPDQLRMILPHSTAGELVMTADLREWRHILSLRADSHAHPSCRQVMIPILLYFKDTMPELFDQIEYDYDFDPNKYAELRIKDNSETGYHIYKFNK